MARRQHFTLMVLLALAAFYSVSYLFSSGTTTATVYESGSAPAPAPPPVALAKDSTPASSSSSSSHEDHDHDHASTSSSPYDDHDDHDHGHGNDSGIDLGQIDSGILKGESIAPKLENATARAELGRASWKVLHTMMARFPEEPTPDESTALKTYIHLFARLYPCGECARHFRALLEKFPPQVSGRNAAAGWLCFVHNQVNERLEKPAFDCNNIGDFYDCGCGEDKKEGEEGEEGADSEEVELREEDS
ncbi:hypothetical protein SODALDRAFT_351461 [Sodiomyces alkalinus F11]|uniref:Sulfhydryl oxidase n=1 Tax=Sodiomyces alkalinus (strain CBS 110278 / VKM F-3762 / F11) TaxID=1314773 RepID=A0A3N2PRG5_SODAK|nr:hypothetical protein SODALDRAFT_351461 [Sodiomyces alkalinus F11]ROT37103.1 hypothetical protein SODALDRAFT_351461 [Sodiomyces alkalinus F11]